MHNELNSELWGLSTVVAADARSILFYDFQNTRTFLNVRYKKKVKKGSKKVYPLPRRYELPPPPPLPFLSAIVHISLLIALSRDSPRSTIFSKDGKGLQYYWQVLYNTFFYTQFSIYYNVPCRSLSHSAFS